VTNRVRAFSNRTYVASLKAAAENAAVKTEEPKAEITNEPSQKASVENHQSVTLSYELRELQHTRDVLELRLSKLPVAKGPQVEIIDRAEPPAHPVFPNHILGFIMLAGAFVTDFTGLRLLKQGVQRKIQPLTK